MLVIKSRYGLRKFYKTCVKYGNCLELYSNYDNVKLRKYYTLELKSLKKSDLKNNYIDLIKFIHEIEELYGCK